MLRCSDVFSGFEPFDRHHAHRSAESQLLLRPTEQSTRTAALSRIEQYLIQRKNILRLVDEPLELPQRHPYYTIMNLIDDIMSAFRRCYSPQPTDAPAKWEMDESASASPSTDAFAQSTREAPQ